VADITLLATSEQRKMPLAGSFKVVEVNTTYKEEQAASLSDFAWTPLVKFDVFFSFSSVLSAISLTLLVHSRCSVFMLTWSQLALNFRWRS
jgi:hypothetical protein